MQSFTYHCPTEIIFGRGAENAVADKLRTFGASRVLILYGGGSVERSGLLISRDGRCVPESAHLLRA